MDRIITPIKLVLSLREFGAVEMCMHTRVTSQHLDVFVLLLRSQPGNVAMWLGPNGEVA